MNWKVVLAFVVWALCASFLLERCQAKLPDGPMSAAEIIEAERHCRSLALEPSYFRSSLFKDVREVHCEESGRTVYF